MTPVGRRTHFTCSDFILSLTLPMHDIEMVPALIKIRDQARRRNAFSTPATGTVPFAVGVNLEAF